VWTGIVVGAKDGLAARKRTPDGTANPNGLSSRADRAVTRYDLATDDTDVADADVDADASTGTRTGAKYPLDPSGSP
jgi:hypothetical protein